MTAACSHRLPMVILTAGIVLLAACQQYREDKARDADISESDSLMPVVLKDIKLFKSESHFEACELHSMCPLLPLQDHRPRTWDATVLASDASEKKVYYTLEYEWKDGRWLRTRSFLGFPESRPGGDSGT